MKSGKPINGNAAIKERFPPAPVPGQKIQPVRSSLPPVFFALTHASPSARFYRHAFCARPHFLHIAPKEGQRANQPHKTKTPPVKTCPTLSNIIQIIRSAPQSHRKTKAVVIIGIILNSRSSKTLTHRSFPTLRAKADNQKPSYCLFFKGFVFCLSAFAPLIGWQNPGEKPGHYRYCLCRLPPVGQRQSLRQQGICFYQRIKK